MEGQGLLGVLLGRLIQSPFIESIMVGDFLGYTSKGKSRFILAGHWIELHGISYLENNSKSNFSVAMGTWISFMFSSAWPLLHNCPIEHPPL